MMPDVKDTKIMPDVIDYQIYGSDMQLVEIELDPNQGVRADPGAMLYMSDHIEMETNTGGGVFSGFKRIFSGESFFITNFINRGDGKERIAFAGPDHGHVIPLDLNALGGTFLCQKDSFLCAAQGIEIEVAFTKRLRAGFFGGEGIMLQRLTGDGYAFVYSGGTIIERELSKGEILRLQTGTAVAFAPTVDYDVQFVGGFKNTLFGGQGLFLTTLTGPGLVYLQSHK